MGLAFRVGPEESMARCGERRGALRTVKECRYPHSPLLIKAMHGALVRTLHAS